MEQILFFKHLDTYGKNITSSGSSGIAKVEGNKLRVPIIRIHLLALFYLLWFMYLSIPTPGWAQDVKNLQGFDKGAQDTMRLDRRMDGYRDKVQNNRMTDQRIGVEERGLRREMKEEDILRLEEQTRSRRARLRKEQEQTEEERRSRAERFWEKKKKVDFTSLAD